MSESNDLAEILRSLQRSAYSLSYFEEETVYNQPLDAEWLYTVNVELKDCFRYAPAKAWDIPNIKTALDLLEAFKSVDEFAHEDTYALRQYDHRAFPTAISKWHSQHLLSYLDRCIKMAAYSSFTNSADDLVDLRYWYKKKPKWLGLNPSAWTAVLHPHFTDYAWATLDDPVAAFLSLRVLKLHATSADKQQWWLSTLENDKRAVWSDDAGDVLLNTLCQDAAFLSDATIRQALDRLEPGFTLLCRLPLSTLAETWHGADVTVSKASPAWLDFTLEHLVLWATADTDRSPSAERRLHEQILDCLRREEDGPAALHRYCHIAALPTLQQHRPALVQAAWDTVVSVGMTDSQRNILLLVHDDLSTPEAAATFLTQVLPGTTCAEVVLPLIEFDAMGV